MIFTDDYYLCPHCYNYLLYLVEDTEVKCAVCGFYAPLKEQEGNENEYMQLSDYRRQ